MVRIEFHEKILSLMRMLREKERTSMEIRELKHVIAELFQEDRVRINFVTDHLLTIKFAKLTGPDIVTFNFEIENEYKEDRFCFV